jgi:hypothetical protein
MYVIFDKNKKFIGYANEEFPEMEKLELQAIKINRDESDLSQYRWIGDMDSGKMTKNA